MDELVQFLRARLDEDEQVARTASHVLRNGAHWSLDDWHGREQPHSLIAQGTADQPVALGHFTADPVPTEQAVHIARHDPARVLRDIEAKRRLVEFHHAKLIEVVNADREERSGYWCAECDGEAFPCRTLRLLALPFADHPDYRAEWRP
jgi:hypothetical protein